MTDDSLIGKRLGGFLIQEKIGSGGMGTVYRGLQEGLDRPVAVKVLQGERAGRNTTLLKRFLREAKSAGQVSHIHVVQVYNAGVSDAVHFIAMEYVDGLSVGQLLDRNKSFLEKEAVSIGRQAALGLQAAAHRGLVHRDVKPDNLLITRGGVVKVADFGLVVDTHAETRLTQEGMAIGTISYMSPEQIRGDKVDLRTDIYSLGATMFHMAAGRPPFAGESAVVLAYKHIHEAPPLLRSLRPEVSEGLEAVVHRMLAKDSAQRHATWEELLEDLDGLTNRGQPASGQTLEFHRKLLVESRPPARSRAFLAGLVALILALAAGTFLAAWGLSRGGDEKPPDPPPLLPAPSGPAFTVEAPKEGEVLGSPQVAVRGTVDAGAVLALEVNGARVAVLEGRFRHELWLDAADPRIRIEALLKDGGRERRTIALRIDVAPPRIAIEEPAGGVLHTREPEALVSGTVSDEGAVRLQADGADAPLKDGRFSLRVPLAAEGERRLVLTATDRVGHRSTAEARLVRDLTPPRLAFQNLPRLVDGGEPAVRLVFEVDEPVARLLVNGREVPVSGKTYELLLALREGVNAVRVEAFDLAGNPAAL
ncbi:MAG: serine/threonine protein kinase, partial [Planctomycetes bacterium]|nr:serine/threonine protein kinase [Planctomycetota bacterium]